MDKETKEYLKEAIIHDIETMADDVSICFDEEETDTPFRIISKLAKFANKNGIDFWDIVKSNRTDYEFRRLTYLFENNNLDGFNDR